MSKKNLDRLFQEKFKDFDAKPDKHVWQNIKKQLEEEKNDKPVLIIPLWLKLSGVAVSILLMLFLGNSLFNTKGTVMGQQNFKLWVESDGRLFAEITTTNGVFSVGSTVSIVNLEFQIAVKRFAKTLAKNEW